MNVILKKYPAFSYIGCYHFQQKRFIKSWKNNLPSISYICLCKYYQGVFMNPLKYQQKFRNHNKIYVHNFPFFFFFYFPLVEGYFVHLDIIKKFEKVFPPWCYSIFLCFWNWILNYWWLRREKVYWEKKLCDGGSLKIYNYLSSFIENNNLIEHSVRKCLVSRNVIGSHGANRGMISVYHL